MFYVGSTQVNKMGGKIKVVKKDGPGTMFRMYVVYNRTSERYTPRSFKDYCAPTMSSEMLQETKVNVDTNPIPRDIHLTCQTAKCEHVFSISSSFQCKDTREEQLWHGG